MSEISEQIQAYPIHSADLWDYLTDMDYMPSRQDRDELLRGAESDSDNMRRVRLWDYFFRIQPEDVGSPQKKEIVELEQNLKDAQRQLGIQTEHCQKEIERLTKEIDQLQNEAKQQRNRAKRQLQGQLTNRSKWQLTIGITTGVTSLFSLFVLLYLLFGQSYFGGTTKFCFTFAWIAFGALSVWQLVSSSRKLSPKQIDQRVTARLDKIGQRMEPRIQKLKQDLEEYRQQLAKLQPDYEKYCQKVKERIQALRIEITNLINQIPVSPSDEEVYGWFREDIARLAETATIRSGLQDRLVRILHADNPFCICGPAELQIHDLIPPPYRDKKLDRHKHLRARCFTTMRDNSFADFYGVYNVQFILVAEDVLATYGTFYDFIVGRQSGERARIQHYPDVVTIETYRGYREIETGNAHNIIMDNVPSLSLSLTSGEKIEVTFPDEDYFKQTNAQGFNSARWRFNPRDTADNAIRVVRERVNEAKRKRE